MTPSDWLLLAVDLADPKPVQPVQLQKILFLLDRKLRPEQKQVDRIYAFAPYDYGPFDSKVYTDAEALAANGLIAISQPMGQTFKVYRVSDSGRECARDIARRIDAPVLTFAESVVKWAQGLTFNQLVSAIYRDYPEMKEHSVFKG